MSLKLAKVLESNVNFSFIRKDKFYNRVVDKTLMASPWINHIGYPKMEYAAEVKWLGFGNWVNQVPFMVIIKGKLT